MVTNFVKKKELHICKFEVCKAVNMKKEKCPFRIKSRPRWTNISNYNLDANSEESGWDI
jgi:hypothetical protein